MIRLFAGTHNGLWQLTETHRDWAVANRWLEGQHVLGLAIAHASNTLYAGTHEGGLFALNLESGVTEQIGDGSLPRGIRTIAENPRTGRIYVGTEPAGVYWSDDRGATWQESSQLRELAAERSWRYPVAGVPAHIRELTVSAHHPNRLYAAAQVGGVLRSDDAGRTWSDSVVGLDPDVHRLVEHPLDANVIYAATGAGGYPGASTFPPEFPQGRPFYESRDAGRTWNCISTSFERTYAIPLEISGDEPDVLVGAVASGIPSAWRQREQGADSALVISDDRGQSWQQVAGGLPSAFRQMIEAIAVHRESGQWFIGTGGSASNRSGGTATPGLIYRAPDPHGPWQKVGIELPSIGTLLAVTDR